MELIFKWVQIWTIALTDLKDSLRTEIKALSPYPQTVKLSRERPLKILLTILILLKLPGAFRGVVSYIKWTDCLHFSALLAHLDRTNIYR